MFQPMHWGILALTGALVAWIVIKGKTWEEKKVIRWLKVCALAVLLFDPAYWFWEARTAGRLDPSTTLPFYLCSLFWMLLPAAVFAKSDRLRQTATAAVCTVCLLCGVFGLTFNIYLDHYPFFSFVPLRSLLYHMMMILVPTAMWATGYYRPRPEDRYGCFLPVGLLLSVCLVLNRLFGWDYCYTAGGLGTPLERVSAVLPKGLFLLVLYGVLLLLIQGIFYRRRFTVDDMDGRLACGLPGTE